MRALVLTNEFPPSIYGGAGVHVDELTRHLRPLIELDIRTFGTHADESPGWRVHGYPPGNDLAGADERLRPMLAALSRDLAMIADPVAADVVHAHTWYTHLAGLLARLAYGIPLVVTVHSLEPLRPWKREQLGGGYDVSSWIERTALETADAVIAPLIGRSTRPLWSPSAGYRDARVRGIAAGLGYRPIYWTVDSGDWTTTATAEAVRSTALDNAVNGAIIVLHFESPRTRVSTAVALPAIIDGLRERGLRLVTASELITGVTP